MSYMSLDDYYLCMFFSYFDIRVTLPSHWFQFSGSWSCLSVGLLPHPHTHHPAAHPTPQHWDSVPNAARILHKVFMLDGLSMRHSHIPTPLRSQNEMWHYMQMWGLKQAGDSAPLPFSSDRPMLSDVCCCRNESFSNVALLFRYCL